MYVDAYMQSRCTKPDGDVLCHYMPDNFGSQVERIQEIYLDAVWNATPIR